MSGLVQADSLATLPLFAPAAGGAGRAAGDG
jgi:hypothetical protein